MAFIVVGLDGSQCSRKAFHEAVREATWRDAGLVVVHVVSYPVMSGYEFSARIDLDALLSRGDKLLEDELAILESEYDGSFPVAVERRVVMGHTGVEMMRAANGEGRDDGETAELVVLGSRGYGGFRGLMLGSVTTYAAHHLSCALLVVPADSTED
ncbi:MAG: universal stress protein [Acidimicrobiales bacterium]